MWPNMTNQQIRRSAEKMMHAAGDKTNWLNGVIRGRPDNLPSTSRATQRPGHSSGWSTTLSSRTLRFCPCGNSIIRIIIRIIITIAIIIIIYVIYIYTHYKVYKSPVIQWLPGMGCRSLGLRAWPKLALIGLWARHGSVEWDGWWKSITVMVLYQL